MAKLFDAPPDATISFPITKMEETPDGDLLIYGKATDGSVDSDDQIVDSEWSGKALQTWLKTGGNVRVQHSPNLYPAGTGVEVNVDHDGAHWVKSLIVEDTAKNLVRKGVLRSYSVGIAKPRIVRDAHARGGRIVDGQIAELSLVDRPANKNCGFTLCKSDTSGNAHVINKVFGDTDIGERESVEKFRFRHGWVPTGGDGDGKDDGMHSTTGHDHVLEGLQAQRDHPKNTPADREMYAGMIQAHLDAKEIHESGGPGASNMSPGTSTDPRLDDVRGAAQDADFARRMPGTKGAAVTATDEDLVTATVSFTPKDLAMILGKSKKPDSVGDDADPTGDHGGPADGDGMDDKLDTGGGKDTATVSEPYHSDLNEDDKGRYGKKSMAELELEKAAKDDKKAVKDDANADDDLDDESPADDVTVGEGDDSLDAIGAHNAGAKKGTGPFAVEKREFSSDQRELLAGSGKALPDGSFPIANKSDLHNAIQAIGRAKDRGKAMAHIKSRASALGATDMLPDTWKQQDVDLEKRGSGRYTHGWIKAGSVSIKPGSNPSLQHVHHENGSKLGSVAKTTDGRFRAIGSPRRAAHTGSQLGDHKTHEDAVQAIVNFHGGDKYATTRKSVDTDAEKMAKVPCPECGKKVKPNAKFCPKCGGKMAEADVEKGMGRSPAAGVRAKTTEGLPDHREPDGAQTAEIERDADLKTDGDGPGTGVPGTDWDAAPPSRPSSNDGTSLKFDGPDEMKRLHDLTCAAFSGKSLNEVYPNLPSIGHAIDVDYWRSAALKSVSAGDMDVAAADLQRAQAADLLKSGEVDVITEAQADLHKSFTDMYPDVPEPTPTELDPGRYTRPYLTAGHARETLTPRGSQPPKPRANEIDAQQFGRGPLTAGQARTSPANKGNAGAPGGMSAGVYYGNAARAQAMNAMIALHDHISGTWPVLCPMATGEPQRAVGKADVTAPEEIVTKSDEPTDPWYTQTPAEMVTKAVTSSNGNGTTVFMPDLVKAALKEALAERDEEIDALRAQVDEMSKMADPREAAYRGPGLMTKSFTTDRNDADEAGPRGVIEKAAKQRDEALFGHLQNRMTYAPTPAEREQARVALQQLYQNNAG